MNVRLGSVVAGVFVVLVAAGCSTDSTSQSASTSPSAAALSSSALPAPPAPSPTQPPRPTAAEAKAVLTGMYAALAERDPAARDTFIVPAVKPKLTTDVVDDVGAVSASVSDVTGDPDAPVAPGTARFLATVTLTQDDGDAQVERHSFVLQTTSSGVKVVGTDLVDVVEWMPADPTPTPEPEDDSAGSGQCRFNEGYGADVPCDSPSCEPGFIFPGAASQCTPASYSGDRRAHQARPLLI